MKCKIEYIVDNIKVAGIFYVIKCDVKDTTVTYVTDQGILNLYMIKNSEAKVIRKHYYNAIIQCDDYVDLTLSAVKDREWEHKLLQESTFDLNDQLIKTCERYDSFKKHVVDQCRIHENSSEYTWQLSQSILNYIENEL